MGSAIALRSGQAKAPVVRSRAEFRDVLDRTLAEASADLRVMRILRAASLRARFEFPDLALVLNVAVGDASEEDLLWEFSDAVPWRPRLKLEMDSEVANAYLQGTESLAVAIARRRVRCSGESRIAMVYLPAFRLVCEPYRRVIKAEYPHLVVR